MVLQFLGEDLSPFIGYQKYLESEQGVTIGQVLAACTSKATKYDTLGLPVCL
jgi:hypothetical protein